jgi:hypothetical protein
MYCLFDASINSTIAHFKGLVAYIDVNLNLKRQSIVVRYKDIYVLCYAIKT